MRFIKPRMEAQLGPRSFRKVISDFDRCNICMQVHSARFSLTHAGFC